MKAPATETMRLALDAIREQHSDAHVHEECDCWITEEDGLRHVYITEDQSGLEKGQVYATFVVRVERQRVVSIERVDSIACSTRRA